MRLSRLSLGVAGRMLASIVSTALLVFIGIGCEANGWIDPSEMGRYDKTPLLKPILSNLDTGIEEPEDQFLNATDARPDDLEVSGSDYVIGKNDLINISISDLVGPGIDTVKTTRVSESGLVSLPLIGQIKAQGLTEAQMEKTIQQAYRDANLIQNPQVSVTVAEARARVFSILGAVGAPGQYAIINSDTRMLDVLVLARDVLAGSDYAYVIRQPETPTTTGNPLLPSPTTQPRRGNFEPRSDAGSSPTEVMHLQTSGAPSEGGIVIMPDGRAVTIQGGGQQPPAATTPAPAAPAAAATPAAPSAPATPKTPGSGFAFNEPGTNQDVRVIKIPLLPLKNGDLKYNIVIRPKDLIIVPGAVFGEYYMGGHVARVGVYSLTGRKITLKQAVVSAGMLDGLAIPRRTEIIRRIGPNQEVYARLYLDQIFDGRQPDIFLKPNDVVQVGTNAAAPFIAAIRGAFRFTYGFGFLYDRNFAPAQRDQL